MTAMGKLGICAVVLLAALHAVIVPTRGPESERVGFILGTFIAATLIPFLIAYIIAGRRRVRDLKRFAYVFSIAGLIFLTLSWLGATNALNVETPEQHIGRLMREAAGTQPIRNTGFGQQRDFDVAVREQFRSLMQANREYTAAAEQLDAGETAKLNTPETLADPDSGGQALKHLHAAYNLDARQEQKINEILQKLREAMQSSSSSPSVQKSLSKGFDNGIATQGLKRQKLISAEKAWVEAEDDLYGFTSQHRNEIKLAGRRIAIANKDVREQFNQKIDSEEALRKDFLEKKQQFSNDQAKLLGSYGLDRKSVGAQ